MCVLAARASELDRDFPFAVARQLFAPALARAGDERRARLLGGPAALAAPLLDLGPPQAELTGEDALWPLFHGLYWLTAALAEEGPLALIVDDAHWADAGSLRFLEFLLPRLQELPVLVAAAARPGEALAALAVDDLARMVQPAALTAPAVARLVGATLAEAPDERFAQACHEATGGNPFLVGELARELARDQVRPRAAHAEIVRGLAPPTVARAVLVRLARLGPEATALARAVAVLERAPLRSAAALADVSEARAGELAAQLADAAILGGS